MRRKVMGIGLTVLVVFVVGVLVGRRGRAPSQPHETLSQHTPSAAVHVDTITVQPTEAAQALEVTGTVKTSLTADIAPKVMSKVAAVTVKEGDRVSAGQTLVRLESADLTAQVRQAEAAVASARAALAQAQTGAVIQRTQSRTRVAQAQAALRQAQEQLSLVKEGSRKQQKQQADEGVRQAEAGKAQADGGVQQARATLAAAQAQLSLVKEGARKQQKLQADAAVRQAEANLKTAQATYDRFKPLADEGVITGQRFDEISLQLEVARSHYETARQQASLVYAGARTQEVRQAEEQVKQAEEDLRLAQAATDENKIKAENVKMLSAQRTQAEANLTAARVQLSYATIVAPFSGVVVKRHVDPGAMATPGAPLITLEDASSFRIESLVPESQMRGVRLGDEAQVTIDALGQTLTGRIAQIVPSADPASRTFIVKVGLPNAPGLSSGLFGRVKFSVGKTQGIFVPESALWRRESLAGVFVVEKGIARKRLVTVGKVEGGQGEVLSGLKGGETIVARDVDRVTDGARVK